VLNELDGLIRIRLNKADEEIDKIKAAYKIDCQDGKVTGLNKHNETFEFSFPVKHAWIQLATCIDQPILLEVKEIKEGLVTVVIKLTRHLTGEDYKQDALRGGPKIPYRVWATSF
jgi:hypothetical protein